MRDLTERHKMKKLVLLVTATALMSSCGYDPDPFDNPRPDGKVYSLKIATPNGIRHYHETVESRCYMLRALELSSVQGASLIENCMVTEPVEGTATGGLFSKEPSSVEDPLAVDVVVIEDPAM